MKAASHLASQPRASCALLTSRVGRAGATQVVFAKTQASLNIQSMPGSLCLRHSSFSLRVLSFPCNSLQQLY